MIVTGGVVSAMSSNASAASGAAPPIASLASGRPAHRGTGIQWRFACRKRRRKRRVLCGRGRDRQRQAIAFLSGALCRSLTAAQDLQNIIERLAVEHWTVSFRPHLTVCSLSVDPFPDVLDAAAAYIREYALLPLKVTRAAVTGAGFVQMQAPARHCCQLRACTATGTAAIFGTTSMPWLRSPIIMVIGG